MTTTLARILLWGTVALYVVLFAFMFIYTGATWDTQAIKQTLQYALHTVIALVGIVSVLAFFIWLFNFYTRGYTPWSK